MTLRPQRIVRGSLLLAALALTTSCGTPTADSGVSMDSVTDTSLTTDAPAALDDALVAPLRRGEPVVALLRVDDGDIERALARRRTSDDAAGDRPTLVSARADAWATHARDLTAALPRGARVRHVYTNLPVIVVELDTLDAARALLRRTDVLSVEPNVAHEAFLTQSLARIGQPAVAAAGYLGTGTSVAVLDTGADWTVADLGSCTAVGTPASCRVAYAADIATDDGRRDDAASPHGTNVSSIVARVAPGTSILALDVFSGGSASSTDILTALDWVVSNKATYNIAAVNMSLGSGLYTSPCTSAFSSAIANVRSAGVVVVVATGNNGATNAIAAPACDPNAISVGAVYEGSYSMVSGSCVDYGPVADQVACFSNSASFLDILAPGTFITAGGVTMSGTSQAAPHVAGAVAVLRATDPAASVDALEARLVTSDTLVHDHRNRVNTPRLALGVAVADCVSGLSVSEIAADAGASSGTVTVTAPGSCTWSASSDAAWLTVGSASGAGTSGLAWSAAANTGAARTAHLLVSGRTVTVTQAANAAPTGSVVIASGATGTRTTAVTLALSAGDGDGVSTMCVSNTSACTAWEAFSTSRSWTLASSGSTTKTVSVWFRDAYGNTSAPVTDTIAYDTVAPVNGTVTMAGGDGSATANWTGFTDALAGVSSYKVVYGTTAPASGCTTGTVAYTGAASSATWTGLTNGTTYTVRVCAIDGAGNTSTGATATVRPAPEYDLPTGTLTLNAGAAWTNNRATTATLTASDASGVTQVCVGTSATCTTFSTYAATKTLTLGTTAGTQTGYAVFRDAYGNVSTAVSDTIGYDATVPVNGTLTATPASGQVTLAWTGFSDATSGVASYKVVYAATTAPRSCAAGAVGWAGTGSSATVTGLTNGTTYGFRVCALDNAGNTSTGVATTSRPAPEYDLPTGSITLNGGAAWTNSRTATASLTASDASGVTQVCVGTSATCTTFTTYAATKTLTLGTTAGTQTGYAVFRDTYGNVSTAVSDTIGYDGTVPVNGTMTATPSSGQVALSWTGFSDAMSGLASYKVVYAATTAPATCAAGTVAWTGTATSATVTGLTDGTTYGFRVCALDNAGNTSTGVATTSRPAPEYDLPTGTITLNGGATWTNSRTATATLSASDASGVTQVCVGASATCSTFTAYGATKTFTLGTAAGTQTGYAVFRDTYNNVSTAVSDTIGYDGTAPVNGTVTATASTGQIALAWTGFSDVTSGLSSYKVVYGTTSPGSACTTGTVAYTGTDTSVTLTGLTAGVRIYARVCALDVAGNTSTGATANALP